MFPREPAGVGVPGVDHALITAEDPGLADRFFRQVFDFYQTEQVVSSLGADAQVLASWMSASMKVHDIAIIGGPQGTLHHFAFQLQDWAQVGRAGSLFSMDEVSIDIDPTQHASPASST